tara:strand:- start:4784 stop:5170 length:387 start_codon:yes stop_codon:yes gene_type:complete
MAYHRASDAFVSDAFPDTVHPASVGGTIIQGDRFYHSGDLGMFYEVSKVEYRIEDIRNNALANGYEITHVDFFMAHGDGRESEPQHFLLNGSDSRTYWKYRVEKPNGELQTRSYCYRFFTIHGRFRKI